MFFCQKKSMPCPSRGQASRQSTGHEFSFAGPRAPGQGKIFFWLGRPAGRQGMIFFSRPAARAEAGQDPPFWTRMACFTTVFHQLGSFSGPRAQLPGGPDLAGIGPDSTEHDFFLGSSQKRIMPCRIWPYFARQATEHVFLFAGPLARRQGMILFTVLKENHALCQKRIMLCRDPW